MRPGVNFIVMTALLVTVAGPLALAGIGFFQSRKTTKSVADGQQTVDCRLVVSSALLCTLAFNLIFLVQELFLVLPKALTPGLYPTLFHNNHDWVGKNPLARLLQASGAMTILLVGFGALGWLYKRPPQTRGSYLLLIWLAYHGIYQSLPQVVVGSFLPQNDVGMSMDYLRFSPLLRQLSALTALMLIVTVAIRLSEPLLNLAVDEPRIDSLAKRSWFMFQVATLPGLLSVFFILPFRVPGSVDQVVIVPVAVTWIGISWLQANAWRTKVRWVNAPLEGSPIPVRTPLIALLVLLLFFQLILRPGVPFYYR